MNRMNNEEIKQSAEEIRDPSPEAEEKAERLNKTAADESVGDGSATEPVGDNPPEEAVSETIAEEPSAEEPVTEEKQATIEEYELTEEAASDLSGETVCEAESGEISDKTEQPEEKPAVSDFYEEFLEEEEDVVIDREEEPFVQPFDPEDEDAELVLFAQRITGAKHSVATTAAPIRTRTPEQNRSVTNGIPMRRGAEGGREAEPAPAPSPASESERKGNVLLGTVVACAAALVLLLSTVVVLVNMAYDKARPADLEMYVSPEDASPIEITQTGVDAPDSVEPEETPEAGESSTGEETDPLAAESASETESETEPETEPPVQQFFVTVDFFEGDDIEVSTAKITLRELLETVGRPLKEGEIPSVDLDTLIASDAVITVAKHEYRTETAEETIPYETEVVKTDLIPRDTTNYLRYGEEGTKTYTYTVEYVNGVETSRTLASEEVTKWPVNEKYELGVGGSFVGKDGVTYTYSHRKVVRATYYNWVGLTHIGHEAGNQSLAVDQTVIPLGTMLYVKNDKYDFGLRMADDTGGAVKGDLVDIWISTEDAATIHKEFCDIGYHYDMEIYFVD